MQELELALADLRARFPYTLEFPYTLDGAPSMSESLLGQAALRGPPTRRSGRSSVARPPDGSGRLSRPP